ncbi:MAG: methyltransferase domain-containing protein [Thermoleophilaceae bacterium]|nr:methyltransferase domain-containing protein [Thermoleophilaceae bacterium]
MPGPLYEATMGRLFAVVYDRLQARAESAGVREMRKGLLSQASGRTLEVGAGTGLNLDHYGPAVGELVLAEPSPHMARRLRAKVSAAGRAAEVVEAPAERLPFPDESFDTVVVTLVLCTVPDQAAALAEIARVLRPDGRLLFLEHVRSEDPRIARWQDRVERPWRFLAAGCHPNRDTLAAIEASPLRVELAARERAPGVPRLVSEGVAGAARRPS